ncbi:MAG: hypothetical protein ACK46Q_12880, partial [Hyphomonas sp.]
MRHFKPLLALLFVSALLVGCDSAHETSEPLLSRDISAELRALTDDVASPVLQRVRTLSPQDRAELRQLAAEAELMAKTDPTEADLRRIKALNHRLERALDRVLAQRDQERIQALTRQILAKRPELRHASSAELAAALGAEMRAFDSLSKMAGDCEGGCAAG